MVKLLRKTHTILYFATVFFYFILAFPFLFFYTRKYQRYFKQIVFIRKWISLLATYSLGIRFKVKTETTIDWSRPYVICPNHTSVLDITALTYTCPQQFSFMGKKELLKNPVTRIFFKTVDITVDRKSKLSAFKAFKKADQMVKEGKSIVIFPEGKIDDEYPPRLHEFKSGSFRIAIENKIQILPIVIHDAWETLWDDGLKKGSSPGTVHISVLSPIDTKDIAPDDYEKLQQEVFQKMRSHWLSPLLHPNVKSKTQQ